MFKVEYWVNYAEEEYVTMSDVGHGFHICFRLSLVTDCQPILKDIKISNVIKDGVEVYVSNENQIKIKEAITKRISYYPKYPAYLMNNKKKIK